jgi:predicted permease
MSFLSAFAENVLPILVIASLGYLFQRWLRPDVQPLSRVTLYVLTPSLIFSSLSNSTVSHHQMGRIGLCVVLVTASLALVNVVLVRALGWDRRRQAAFMLTTLFGNVGNYGLPLTGFAFGVEGQALAVVYYVVSAVLVYSVGVYLASLGQQTAREALGNVFRLPLVYAAGAALVVNVANLHLPLPLTRAIDLAGQGAVPLMILLLGMQLARTRVGGHVAPALLASAMKLIASAALALGWTTWLGLGDLAQGICIVQAAMPSAVMTTLLALEFGTHPGLVTTTVMVSTLLSLVTLSVLLTLVT